MSMRARVLRLQRLAARRDGALIRWAEQQPGESLADFAARAREARVRLVRLAPDQPVEAGDRFSATRIRFLTWAAPSADEWAKRSATLHKAQADEAAERAAAEGAAVLRRDSRNS